MYETLRVVVFAVGAAQGLFLAVALLLKDTANRTATRLLATLAGVFAVLLAGELAVALDPTDTTAWIPFLSINLELAIGPLLLLFVRSLFQPDRNWRRRDWVHFLPLALGVACWLLLYAALSRGQTPFGISGLQTLTLPYLLFKIGFFYAYLAWALRTFDFEVSRTPGFSAGRRAVSVTWIRRWLLLLGATAGVLYGLALLSALAPTVRLESDDVASFVLAILSYAISLLVLLRPSFLSVRPRPRPDPRRAAEAARLKEWIEREKPYLDPDLTLGGLANSAGLSENELSALLNEGLGTTFYDLVSRCRLAHFERLAGDETLSGRSVLELAFEAGFNSKASFYRYFRRIHGTTPKAFRDRLLKEPAKSSRG